MQYHLVRSVEKRLKNLSSWLCSANVLGHTSWYTITNSLMVMKYIHFFTGGLPCYAPPKGWIAHKNAELPAWKFIDFKLHTPQYCSLDAVSLLFLLKHTSWSVTKAQNPDCLASHTYMPLSFWQTSLNSLKTNTCLGRAPYFLCINLSNIMDSDENLAIHCREL